MLTETQRKQLNKLSVPKLIEYIDNGTVSFPEDFEYVSEEKKQQVEQKIAERPNPQEIRDWNAIDTLSTTDAELKQKLQTYIQKWSRSNPPQNHIAEAESIIREIDNRLRDQEHEKERADWDNLDLFDSEAIIRYFDKYPNTAHKDEIDDALWSLTSSNAKPINAIRDYLKHFPNGRHSYEARKALEDYTLWQEIKSRRKLIEVNEFIKENADSPFNTEARILLSELKDEEILAMKANPAYPAETVLAYLDQYGIFTDNELISEGIATKRSLEILRDYGTVRFSLPDIGVECDRCQKSCDSGRTDVYLFGVPATGKSCILMGLIGSSMADVNLVKSGGPYAAALKQYLDAGCTIPQTPANFIATLEYDIPNNDKNHYVNLVEMAGEEFVNKLADNPDSTISFADMGDGAPQLLNNGNRKSFFLIVDPTSHTAISNRTIQREDAEGNIYHDIITRRINQQITLKKMVDLFAAPENAQIMRNVDSIHIIVTKADTLGDETTRDEKAYELFMGRYSSIIRPLQNLCDKYGINIATNGFPKLYTFSLGQFYVGGVYQYDETDANKLINVIKGNVWGEKKPSFLDKVRAIVNNPII